jgi:hypothetical protein
MHVFNFYMNKSLFNFFKVGYHIGQKSIAKYSVVFARHWKFSKSKEGVGLG